MDSGSRKPRPKSEETEQNCHPLRVNQVRLQRRRFVETHVGMGINLLSKRNSSSGPATLRVLCPQGCTACGSCARLCDGWPRVSPPGACVVAVRTSVTGGLECRLQGPVATLMAD